MKRFSFKGEDARRASRNSFVRAVLTVGAIACAVSAAEARITQLQVVRLESPTFGGITFGGVGAYEKITARASGELDPTLAANALITDIQFAPRNARGMVEYSMDVVIVKPIDPSKGSGKIFYDVVNRGNNLSYATFNQAAAPAKNANTDAAGAGTGLLMRRGYTLVWSGWEDPRIIGTNANLLSASLPIARSPRTIASATPMRPAAAISGIFPRRWNFHSRTACGRTCSPVPSTAS